MLKFIFFSLRPTALANTESLPWSLYTYCRN